MNTKPKILIWDIENSHNVVLSFDLYPEYIPHHNIIQERYIFCVSYKWYGQKKIHTISILDDPKRFKKDIHDDYYVVSEFRKILEKADAHVAHNGNKFDLPMFNGRMLKHGLKPVPKSKSIDTLLIARRYFRLNSNKLDYLAKYLDYEGKMQNPKGLWIDCLNGNVKALKHMIKYNKQDIDILNFVFERLMPYIHNDQLNMGMFLKGARCVNATCGSRDIQWRGNFNLTRVNKYRRFQCQKCGRWSDERKAFGKDKPELK